MPPEENWERHRAKVTRNVAEIIDQENGHRVENIKFILDIGNGKVEELISYNQLLQHLKNAQDNDMGMDQELYKFRANIGQQGPLLASDPSPSFLLMTQLPGQHMPKRMISLLWKDGIGSGTLPRKIKSLQGQSNIVRSGKSGDQTWRPCNLTLKNRNSKCYDAIKQEMESMLEYNVFKMWDEAILDKYKKVMNSPKGYHRI